MVNSMWTGNKYSSLTASASNENLTAPITPYGSACRLYRIPSLPKSRNKSGIPVPTINRDLPNVSTFRG